MTFGGSLFLLATGAILRYAIEDRWDIVNLEVVGLILIIVGAIGFAVSVWYATGFRRPREPRDPAPRDPDAVQRY